MFASTTLLMLIVGFKWLVNCIFPPAVVEEVVAWHLWMAKLKDMAEKLKEPSQRMLKESFKLSSKLFSFATHAFVEGLKSLKSQGC